MKVTDKMIDEFRQFNPAARNIRAALETILRDVPDVEHFAFAGHPDNPVYLHPLCGTVVDVVPGTDTWEDVEQGNCDCETVAPWLRIYVLKTEV